MTPILVKRAVTLSEINDLGLRGLTPPAITPRHSRPRTGETDMVATRAPLPSRLRRFLSAYTDTRVSVYAQTNASSEGSETPQGPIVSSGDGEVGCAVCPGGVFVVVLAGSEAAVEVADEAVAEGS
jgi:hypothetical protein